MPRKQKVCVCSHFFSFHEPDGPCNVCACRGFAEMDKDTRKAFDAIVRDEHSASARGNRLAGDLAVARDLVRRLVDGLGRHAEIGDAALLDEARRWLGDP